MQPCPSLTGQIVLKGSGSTAPPDFTRVQLRLESRATATPGLIAPSAIVAADGTFRFDDVIPGAVRLTATVPASVGAAAAWTSRSAIVGGSDMMDMPFTVEPGQNISGVVVTLVDSAAEIGGRLLDAPGNTGPQLYVLVFSRDKTHWAPGSRRVASVLASDTGAYAITSLPPGDYYLCALTDLDNDLRFDATYLEQLVPAAIAITLGEGEKLKKDLQVSR